MKNDKEILQLTTAFESEVNFKAVSIFNEGESHIFFL